jgi:hypothetical protein
MDNPAPNQQVSWWDVHEFVAPLLAQVGSWPTVGTVEWVALDDGDPAKWAAVASAAEHWALHIESCQQAQCDASRAISAAENWTAIAQHHRNHAEFYAARPWLKRIAS